MDAILRENILLRHLISRCNTFAVLNYSRENISGKQNSFAWPVIRAVYDGNDCFVLHSRLPRLWGGTALMGEQLLCERARKCG